jgi:hypothetical protein
MLFARLTDYPNYRIYINGDIYSENGNRSKYLKHHINARTNYKYASLWNEDGEKLFKIHRLMAICFLPCNKSFDKVQVDHININKEDNSIYNLRWCDKGSQERNKKYKPTNTTFPFINGRMQNEKPTIIYCCQLQRDGKLLFRKRRAKLEDAVNVMREFLINNMSVLEGYPEETINIIIDKYNLR